MATQMNSFTARSAGGWSRLTLLQLEVPKLGTILMIACRGNRDKKDQVVCARFPEKLMALC